MKSEIKTMAYRTVEAGLKGVTYLAQTAVAGLTLGLVGALIMPEYREYVQVEPLARLYLWLGVLIAVPFISLKLVQRNRNSNSTT